MSVPTNLPAIDVPANSPQGAVIRPGSDPLDGATVSPEVRALVEAGEFAAAREKLLALGLEMPAERLRRMQIDYPLTRAELEAEFRSRLGGFRAEELDGWIALGLIDWMRIEGEARFVSATVSNVFWLRPELEARRLDPSDRGMVNFVRRGLEAIRFDALGHWATAGRGEPVARVRPTQWHMRTVWELDAGAENAGRRVRVWLPLPQENDFQTHVRVVEASPTPTNIAAGDAPQRTVYFTGMTNAAGQAKVELLAEYTSWSRVVSGDRLNYAMAQSENEWARATAPLAEWLREEEHVRFGPELREIAAAIRGAEGGPLPPGRYARRAYDWISQNIRYSYAREYSTLTEIPHYTCARRTGDCGQVALLFIALCRMGGVPARWQSGWTCYNAWTGLHDWAEVWFPGLGWLPVDPYMGMWAARYAPLLRAEERSAVADFYFGSMDSHRMSSNSAHGGNFDPPKRSMRSDTVDNQRGEAEWDDGTNLFFGDFRRRTSFERLDRRTNTEETSP